jgi:uncharacterized protein (DUF433 family)
MLATQTRYEHIVLNDANLPMIAGTNTKVIELVLDRMAYGWSPEELQFQHPSLTLGQIYSALAYYADHQQTLDQEIEHRLRDVEKIQKTIRPGTLEARLKVKGLL